MLNATSRRASREPLQEAVHRARSGGEGSSAFRALEALLAPRLRRYFSGNSFAYEDAEDLTQAVLTRVWQGLPRLEDEAKFLPWLFAIARNVRRGLAARQKERV